LTYGSQFVLKSMQNVFIEANEWVKSEMKCQNM
jgi:hypothetical protein